jgi:serine/threonine protein kinase
MFDNTETDSLELLRFYPSLTAIDGFEDDLHERVRQVGRIPDHAFPLIVAVERLEGDGALALVSTHTPGKRLSAFFDKPGPRRGLNPSFVTGIATQVIKALTILQSKGDDLTHSAITPDRIVVTTGGHICVVEHVLGTSPSSPQSVCIAAVA